VATSRDFEDHIFVDIREQQLHLLVFERDIFAEVTIMFFLISVADGLEFFIVHIFNIL
jgi:hypothetical protein